MRDPFKVLGIEPTSDKKQIKKVYAKLAARYHPEEYPEKWQEIHEAYEAAIQFASAIGEDAWTEEEEQKKSDSFSGLENRAEADSIVVWEENTEQKTAVEVSAEKEYIDKDAVPESVPEAISLEKSKDIEEEETAFDFEHILSKLERRAGPHLAGASNLFGTVKRGTGTGSSVVECVFSVCSFSGKSISAGVMGTLWRNFCRTECF